MCYLPATSEILIDHGIPFKLLLLQSLKKKPTTKVGDPFSPPFEDGIFIADLSLTHSLVYNKFCICDHHVVAFPKDFEH